MYRFVCKFDSGLDFACICDYCEVFGFDLRLFVDCFILILVI